MTAISTSLCSATLGAMIFFGAVVAPIVFTTLDQNVAGQFLRRLFPRLYLFCGVLIGLSTVFIISTGDLINGAILGVTCLLFFVSRGPLTSAINRARDAQLDGDEMAGKRFDRLHALSTRIFGLQALALLYILVSPSL